MTCSTWHATYVKADYTSAFTPTRELEFIGFESLLQNLEKQDETGFPGANIIMVGLFGGWVVDYSCSLGRLVVSAFYDFPLGNYPGLKLFVSDLDPFPHD